MEWETKHRGTISGDKYSYSLDMGIVKLYIEHTPEGYKVELLGYKSATLRTRFITLELAKEAGINYANRRIKEVLEKLANTP